MDSTRSKRRFTKFQSILFFGLSLTLFHPEDAIISSADASNHMITPPHEVMVRALAHTNPITANSAAQMTVYVPAIEIILPPPPPVVSKGGKNSSSSGASSSYSGENPQQYLENIAAGYGVNIVWGTSACGREAAGCYMGGSTIYVNTKMYSSWDKAKGSGRNVVLHEVAHALTLWKCGTVLVGGERFENVTDAHAVLLGASSGTGYGYNDQDMEIATLLTQGICYGA